MNKKKEDVEKLNQAHVDALDILITPLIMVIEQNYVINADVAREILNDWDKARIPS